MTNKADPLFRFVVRATESGGADAGSMVKYLRDVVLEDCRARDCPPTTGPQVL